MMNIKFISAFQKFGLSIVLNLLWIFPVSGQLIWLESQFDKENKVALSDLNKESEVVHLAKESSLINYNPAARILNQHIDIKLDISHFNQCNIFTVFKPAPHSAESLIWSIKESSTEQLSLTDQRMVDFSSGRFMNFIDFDPEHTQLNTYQHYKNNYAGNMLSIGGSFTDSEIPVGLFDGQLAEIIVFNQVLAPESKARLESALAIKYSVPLSKGHNYLDAHGKIIWNVEKSEVYTNRVAGIGRSDVFHLNQKQSQSALGSGFIAIGMEKIYDRNIQNKANQNDQSYLLWGDDNGILEFQKLIAKPDQIQRKWKMEMERYSGHPIINMQFSHKDLTNEIKADEWLWLALSKTEDFDLDNTAYFAFKSQNNSEFLETTFELNENTNKYFTFIKAPKVWADLEVKSNNCAEKLPGSLSFIPMGGTLPYSINISSKENNYENVFKVDHTHKMEIEDLRLGHYSFTIVDSHDDKWTTEFYINTEEILPPKIENKYVLSDKELTINAGLDLPDNYTYLWQLPDGSTSFDEELSIHQAGHYLLQIGLYGCTSLFPFEVISMDNNILNASVSPNPTINGYFTLNASLKESTPYSIHINTIDGQWVSTYSYPSAKYIHRSLKVPVTGIYLITLVSGSSKITKKLVANLGQ